MCGRAGRVHREARDSQGSPDVLRHGEPRLDNICHWCTDDVDALVANAVAGRERHRRTCRGDELNGVQAHELPLEFLNVNI